MDSWTPNASILIVHEEDTIVALATPPGRGGIGIIRISGQSVRQISERMLKKEKVQPRYAHYGPFYGKKDTLLDIGIALFFDAPHSFTGEDVLELQGHGGPIVMDQLIQTALSYGARIAMPGEFSKRAFLNGKIDLSQAEAVADLINASTEEAARGALNSMQGVFSLFVRRMREAVIALRTYLEASIDFSDEDIDILEEGAVISRISDLRIQIKKLIADTQQGVLLQEGISIAILGAPNVGKSSLFNLLTGHDSAIVTDMPGTTRDVLKETIQISGHQLYIMDTAGIRDDAGIIEKEGILRAKKTASLANHILLVMNGAEMLDPVNRERSVQQFFHDADLPFASFERRITIVLNKIDLVDISQYSPSKHNEYLVSVKTQEGITALKAHIETLLGANAANEGKFIARRRHLDALARAQAILVSMEERLADCRTIELLAEDLREVQQALGEITGEFSSDDLLGEIFSTFCVGK